MKTRLKESYKWSAFAFTMTFIIACILSVTATTILQGVGWGIGVLIVFIVVLIGIFFDMIGLASAAASETPFHAMASERIRGSRQAIGITRNADRFSSFCNDVVGDIAGVISGAASALVIIEFIRTIDAENTLLHTVITVLFTGFISGITVGGKALGKTYSIHHSTSIILFVGRILYILERRFGITIFGNKKGKSNNGKRGKKRAAE